MLSDLASEPALALKELQAAIYLNPESIAPEAIAPPYANPESVEIYDDYILALRAAGTASVAGAASTPRHTGSRASGRTAARSGAGAHSGLNHATTTSASARRVPAAAAALRAAQRRRALRLLGIRTPRAAG